MEIRERKKALRTQMLNQRNMLKKSMKHSYDQWICEQLWEEIQERGAHNIHTYLPMGAEINIIPLIRKMLENGCTVVCPKTLPKPRMLNLELKALNELEQGVFGTYHPANSTPFHGSYDLIIVPGLAFDHNGYRLGYGGGYYDNFLSDHPTVYKLGVCYPFQIFQSIPIHDHDIPLDKVLYKSAEAMTS